jgi:hypothetical protein
MSVVMTRWIELGLQTLLVMVLASCDDAVDPTALRFYVYADMPLARVRTFLLDENENTPPDGRFYDLPPQDAGASDDNLLFSVEVERTADSVNRNQAVLRFEGYSPEAPDGPIVVRQTVRADFADRETKLVQIYLSSACTNAIACPPRQSCDPSTGMCAPTPTLAGGRFEAATDLGRYEPRAAPRQCSGDLQTDPRHCGGCDVACAYPLCRAGSCVPTAYTPDSAESEYRNDSIDITAVYLRRLVLPGATGLAAVGVVSDQIGAKFRLLVASDEDGKPGQLLVDQDVLVERPPRLGADRQLHGAEVAFEEPLRPAGAAVWIGFEAQDAKVALVRFRGKTEEWVGISTTDIGRSESPRLELLGLSPYVYAVSYP